MQINFSDVKIRENLDTLMNLVLSQREKVKKSNEHTINITLQCMHANIV